MAPTFGLHGGFNGDADKLARARGLAEILAAGKAPPTSDIIDLLAELPRSGRLEFIATSVLTSSCSEQVVSDLYNACFETGSESAAESDFDDFIVVCTDAKSAALDVSKRFVLSALLAVLPPENKMVIELLNRYQKSTSTAFRQQLLGMAVASPHMTDDQLYKLYSEAVEVERSAMVSAARSKDFRRKFISLLIEKGDLDRQSNLQYADVETVRKALLKPDATDQTRRLAAVLRNWDVHGDTYLEFLQQLIDEAGDNPIDRGLAYFNFHRAAKDRVPPKYIEGMLKICMENELWEIPMCAAPAAKEYFRKYGIESGFRAAEILFSETQMNCPIRIFPSSELLKKIENTEALLNTFIERKDGKVLLLDGCASAFRSVLQMNPKKRTDRLAHQKLAIEVFEKASPESICEMILYEQRTKTPGAAKDMSREARCLTCVAIYAWLRVKENWQHKAMAKAWHDMFRRCKPADALLLLDSKRWPGVQGIDRLREIWAKTQLGEWSKHLDRCVRLLEVATQSVDREAIRSAMTSYGGYIGVVFREFITLAAEIEESAEGSIQMRLFLIDAAVNLVKKQNTAIWSLRKDTGAEGKAAQELCKAMEDLMADLFERVGRVLKTRGPDGEDFPDLANVNKVVSHVKEVIKSKAGGTLVRRGGKAADKFLAFLKRNSEVFQLPKKVLDDGMLVRKVGRIGEEVQCTVAVLFNASEGTKPFNDLKSLVSELLKSLGNKQGGLLVHNDINMDTARKLWQWFCTASFQPLNLETGLAKNSKDRRFEPQVRSARLSFIEHAVCFPTPLFEEEKDRILKFALIACEANRDDKNTIGAYLRSCGLTPAFVVEAKKNPSMKITELFAQGTRGALRAEIGLREKMEEATKTTEATERMSARIALFKEALLELHTDVLASERQTDFFAEMLKKTASATRNEMGLTRVDFYGTVEMVLDSMVSASYEIQNEQEALKFTKSICSTLLQMLSDDLSKRDSIAVGTFNRIKDKLAKTILGKSKDKLHHAHPLVCTEWFSTSLAIGKLICKKKDGLDHWKETVKFGVSGNNNSLCAIQRLSLEKLQEAVKGEGVGIMEAVTKQWHKTKNSVADSRQAQVCGKDRAAIAVNALREQSEGSFDKMIKFTAPNDSAWESQEVKQNAIMERIQDLINFAGAEWNQVPEIVTNVEAAAEFFNSIADGKTKLPDEVVKSMAEMWMNTLLGQIWCTCDDRSYSINNDLYHKLEWALLRALVVKCHRDLAKRLAEHILQAETHNRSLPGLSYSEVILARVVAGRPVNRKTPEGAGQAAARLLEKVRKLIDVSPSAVHLSLVVKELSARRDDVLGTFIGKTQGDVNGAFGPVVLPRDEGSPLVLPLGQKELAVLNGEHASRAAKSSLALGMGVDASTTERERAMTQFVLSPTVSHTDIVELLENLLKEEKPSEDTKALVEAIVLLVFKTEGAWHVLKYLLSPPVLKKCAQRTTATVLKNLCGWQSSDKVVAVLRWLLVSKRRSSVSVFLHKQVLRLLSESRSGEAAEVLLDEWTNRESKGTPEDVVHEMVRLSIVRLANDIDNNAPEAVREALWKILSDAAEPNSKVPPATYLLLASMRWDPLVSSVKQKDLPPLSTPTLEFMRQEPDSMTPEDEEMYDLQPKLDVPVAFKFRAPQSDAEAEGPARVKAIVEKLVLSCPVVPIRHLAAAVPYWFDWQAVTGKVSITTLDKLRDGFLALEEPLSKLQGLHDNASHTIRFAPEQFAAAYGQFVHISLRNTYGMDTKNEIAQHYAATVEKLLWAYVRAPMLCDPLRKYVESVVRTLVGEQETITNDILISNLEPTKHLQRARIANWDILRCRSGSAGQPVCGESDGESDDDDDCDYGSDDDEDESDVDDSGSDC